MNTMELEQLILLRDSGEISPVQLQELQRLEQENPAVRKQAEITSRILNAARQDTTPSQLNEVTRSSILEAGKVALHESLAVPTAAVPPSRPTGTLIAWLPPTAWAAAATVVIGALLGVLVLFNSNTPPAGGPGPLAAQSIDLMAVDLLLVETNPIDEQLASVEALLSQVPSGTLEMAFNDDETDSLARELLALEETRI